MHELVGKHLAKLKDYAMTVTSSEKLQILLVFEFEFNDQTKELTWYGSFKEGRAREITLDTLFLCGFSGEDLSILAELNTSGALDCDQQVQIVVELREDLQGKERLQISWVNPVGGAAFKNRLTRKEAAIKLLGLNLKEELLARQNAGTKNNSAPSAAPANSTMFTANDIPF